MIDFDLTDPINVIKVMVGDIDCDDPLMSANMYQQILDMFDKSECYGEPIQIWYSAKYAARIFIAEYGHTGMRTRERVNAVELEFYGGERYRNYRDLVEWLENNPPVGSTENGISLFHFGGTFDGYRNLPSLQYINACLNGFWGWSWKDGYLLSTGG